MPTIAIGGGGPPAVAETSSKNSEGSNWLVTGAMTSYLGSLVTEAQASRTFGLPDQTGNTSDFLLRRQATPYSRIIAIHRCCKSTIQEKHLLAHLPFQPTGTRPFRLPRPSVSSGKTSFLRRLYVPGNWRPSRS